MAKNQSDVENLVKNCLIVAIFRPCTRVPLFKYCVTALSRWNLIFDVSLSESLWTTNPKWLKRIALFSRETKRGIRNFGSCWLRMRKIFRFAVLDMKFCPKEENICISFTPLHEWIWMNLNEFEWIWMNFKSDLCVNYHLLSFPTSYPTQQN